MKFFFITNSVELARFALQNGADRIFVDLEFLGKTQRQGHLDTLISRHAVSDVRLLRPHVPVGQLLVRINPLNENSYDEIEEVIEAGADIVMLPMFRTPRDVELFVSAVGGRARTMLLVETVAAMESLDSCISVHGVDEVHIGLNDLHLDLGKRFMFEPLSSGLVDGMAAVLNARGVPFGIGGVARVGEGMLPAELILAEHARLGSTAAILSRTFHRQGRTVDEIMGHMDFAAEVAMLRHAYNHHINAGSEQLQASHRSVVRIVDQIVARISANDLVGSL